jgi:hypothetical protein
MVMITKKSYILYTLLSILDITQYHKRREGVEGQERAKKN